MKKLLLSAVMGATLLSGCATIVSESSYPVAILSDPSHAEFSIQNRAGYVVSRGLTPQVVTLKAGAGYFKKEHYTITFKKTGFSTKSISLRPSVDGWYIGGNLVFGGFIGWLIVDPLTGAMYKLPEQVRIDLGEPTGLNIMTLESLTPSQREKLIKINSLR